MFDMNHFSFIIIDWYLSDVEISIGDWMIFWKGGVEEATLPCVYRASRMWTCPGSPCVCVCVLYVYMCNGCPSWSGCVVLCWLDRLYTRDFTHHFYSKTPIGIRAHRTYVVYVVRICYVLFWSPPLSLSLSLSLSRHCLCVWTLSLSLFPLYFYCFYFTYMLCLFPSLSLPLSLFFSLIPRSLFFASVYLLVSRQDTTFFFGSLSLPNHHIIVLYMIVQSSTIYGSVTSIWLQLFVHIRQ